MSQLLVKNFIELDFPTQPDTYRHLSYKDRICSENIPIQLTGCQMSCSYRFPLESYFKIRHFNSKTRVQNRSVALLFFTNFVPPKVCLFLDRSCTIFSWLNFMVMLYYDWLGLLWLQIWVNWRSRNCDVITNGF